MDFNYLLNKKEIYENKPRSPIPPLHHQDRILLDMER